MKWTQAPPASAGPFSFVSSEAEGRKVLFAAKRGGRAERLQKGPQTLLLSLEGFAGESLLSGSKRSETGSGDFHLENGSDAFFIFIGKETCEGGAFRDVFRAGCGRQSSDPPD